MSRFHHKSLIDRFKSQTRLFFKRILASNPLLPFSVFILITGVTAGLILTQSSTELRQRAQMNPYVICIDGSTPIIGGVEAGGCRCPRGEVVDPDTPCPPVVPTNTPHLISSPMCIQDGQIIGQGGAICCSGQTHQRDNDVVCGLRPNSTCTGSCVSSTKGTCSEIGRYTAVGTCVEKVGENMLCCGTSIAYSPTPFPTPICSLGEYRCENNTEYYCYTPNAEASTSCGKSGCQGNRCATPTPKPTTTSRPTTTQTLDSDTCSGMCVSAPNCSRLGKASAIGSCQNPSHVCCGSTGGQECIPNTCVQRPSVFSPYAEDYDEYYPGGWGAWCGSDGTFGFQPSICGTGEDCAGTPDTICIQPGLRCIGGRRLYDETCVYQTPTPKVITAINCQINSDCGLGYLCLRDTGDNSFSCQPEVKSRDCWTYNQNTKQCEAFKSFAGVSCPNGSSPNSDICTHPSLQSGSEQVSCNSNPINGRENYCMGNNQISCDKDGNTKIEPCPYGCKDGNGGCLLPVEGDACVIGTQWCDGNFAATCKLNYPGGGAAMFVSAFREPCAYGCDYTKNSCYPNPNTLTYNQILEQQIESKYGISINVKVDDKENVYNTLSVLEETLGTSTPFLLDQVKFFEIYPEEITGTTKGFTHQNGSVSIKICKPDEIINRNCQHTILHEVAHNTEEIQVSSSRCPENNTCTAIEGFINAAEKDENPLFFDSTGHIIMEQSDIAGIDDNDITPFFDDPEMMVFFLSENDHATYTEFFANYKSIYFMEPERFKASHPTIYSFFQDIYHKYSD